MRINGYQIAVKQTLGKMITEYNDLHMALSEIRSVLVEKQAFDSLTKTEQRVFDVVTHALKNADNWLRVGMRVEATRDIENAEGQIVARTGQIGIVRSVGQDGDYGEVEFSSDLIGDYKILVHAGGLDQVITTQR